MDTSLVTTPADWPQTVAAARHVQEQLRAQVVQTALPQPPRRVAGVDVGFEAGGSITRAAVVVLDFPALTVREHAIARLPTRFPYIPGYLSFRETPAVLAALEQLREQPDLLLCDGHGIAHPRRFGIACHLGVLLDIPSIGVAKKKLVGVYTREPVDKGDWVKLHDKTETIGAVLRSKDKVKPLFISPGHRITLEQAVEYVLACTTRYRLPEPTRLADKLSKAGGQL